MDRLGWPMIANMLNQTPGISIPNYTQDYLESYPPPEDAKILETKPIKTSKKCFNCGGKIIPWLGSQSHSIHYCVFLWILININIPGFCFFLEDGHEVSKCKKPFDKQAFNRNRAKFKATGLQYGRYHKEEKNRKLKPGEISDSLRQSLGEWSLSNR